MLHRITNVGHRRKSETLDLKRKKLILTDLQNLQTYFLCDDLVLTIVQNHCNKLSCH